MTMCIEDSLCFAYKNINLCLIYIHRKVSTHIQEAYIYISLSVQIARYMQSVN